MKKSLSIFLFLTSFLVFFINITSAKMDKITEQYNAIIYTDVVCENGHIVLNWMLENTEKSVIKVLEGALPWRINGYGAKYDLFSPEFKPLDVKVFVIGSHVLNEIEINPNERITGTTPLSTIIPGLNEIISNNFIILEWSYRLRPLNYSSSKLYKGRLKVGC